MTFSLCVINHTATQSHEVGMLHAFLHLGIMWKLKCQIYAPDASPQGNSIRTDETVGWVGPKDDFDTQQKTQIFAPRRKTNPDQPVQPVATLT
jgi:hypothetical protein